MVTNTLNSPHIIGLLDRLFAEDETSESAQEIVAHSDASHLITSKTEYRQFYSLLKDVPLPGFPRNWIPTLHAGAFHSCAIHP